MKISRIAVTIALVVSAMFTLTACPGSDQGPDTQTPYTPPAPGEEDGNADCDLDDMIELDDDCFDS